MKYIKYKNKKVTTIFNSRQQNKCVQNLSKV